MKPSLENAKKERSAFQAETLEKLIEEKGFDREKLRLSIGCGGQRYSNCINLDLEKAEELNPKLPLDVDIAGDVTKGLPFPDGSFSEIFLMHVIEHIQRVCHPRVFSEIHRLLKSDGRLILGFPVFIECAKRFAENRYGGRWTYYNCTIFGRQAYPGDFHVTACERQDMTDRLICAGFEDIKYLRHSINAIMTARKGEKLKEHLL